MSTASRRGDAAARQCDQVSVAARHGAILGQHSHQTRICGEPARLNQDGNLGSFLARPEILKHLTQVCGTDVNHGQIMLAAAGAAEFGGRGGAGDFNLSGAERGSEISQAL